MLCTAFFALFTTSYANAGDEKIIDNPILLQFKSKGGVVEFLGHSYGMDGWMLKDEKNNLQYVYTNPEGATIMGVMFAPTGEVETAKQIEEYKVKKSGNQKALDTITRNSPDKAEMIYSSFERANWISIGNDKAPYFYSAMDMESKKSQAFIKKLMPFIEQGNVNVRIIPIATSENSYYAAAALFSSDSPKETLFKYINGDEAILKTIEIKEMALSKLDINAELARSTAIKGVPFNLYRRPIDGKILAISGIPDNILVLLADLQKPVTMGDPTALPSASDVAKLAPAETPITAAPAADAGKTVTTPAPVINGDEETTLTPEEKIIVPVAKKTPPAFKSKKMKPITKGKE